MKRAWYKWMSVGLVLAFLAGCSGSEETTLPPTVTPPSPNLDTQLDPAPNPTTDSRIPDLSTATTVFLADTTNYTAVREVFQGLGLVLPLVGDALIDFKFGWDQDNSLAGVMQFAVEDQLGLLYTRMKSFTGSIGETGNNVIDVIFSDDELVVRVLGAINGNNVDGSFYVRRREAGEHACKEIDWSCQVVQTSPGTWWYYGNVTPPTCDVSQYEEDVIQPCKDYMAIGNSNVIPGGSFSQEFNQWF